MSKLSENIKMYRKLNNLTQVDLAKILGIAPTAVSAWEVGRNQPLMDNIERMASIFNIKKSELLGESNSHDSSASNILSVYNQLTPPRQRKVYTFAQHQLDKQNNGVEESSAIYLVGQTAAGKPLEYGQLQPEQISVDVPKGADRALNVKGDSMEPLIKDGSIVFYKDQPTVENGEIAIVEIDGSEVTCKKFYFDGDKVTLKSINEKYEDMVFSNGVRIIGKVII